MRLCGNQRPAPVMSTGNQMFIKFNAISFEAQEGSRFKSRWMKIDESSPIRPLIRSLDSCEEELYVNASRTYVTSPNYPQCVEHSFNPKGFIFVVWGGEGWKVP